MRISELIIRLREIEAEHGDLLVFQPAAEVGLLQLASVEAKRVRQATPVDLFGKFAATVTDFDDDITWRGSGYQIEAEAGEAANELSLILIGARRRA